VNPRYYLPAPKGYRDRGCLRLLRALHVPYRRLRHVKGVATPIRVLGNRIGRTRYVPRYKSNKMIMDCRMAVALARANEIFKVNQIHALVFSNFYCWRYVEETGRLSRHALGLAVDVHAFIDRQGRRLEVERDYQKGLGRGRTCEGRAKSYRARVLRDLACDLDAREGADSRLQQGAPEPLSPLGLPSTGPEAVPAVPHRAHGGPGHHVPVDLDAADASLLLLGADTAHREAALAQAAPLVPVEASPRRETR